MQLVNEIKDLIEKKDYEKSSEKFHSTPVLDYTSKYSLLTIQDFEYFYYTKKKKNPVFFRILLNYISLINIIYSIIKRPLEFHKILYYFGAKFSYIIKEENKEFIKYILFVKTNTKCYDTVLQKGKEVFSGFDSLPLDKIDYDFTELGRDKAGIGYTFQELGTYFLMDEVIGKDKGKEFPNLLFYIKSTKNIEDLRSKIFLNPKDKKIDLNERLLYSGLNEFDYVIRINQNHDIDNNPFFKNIYSESKKINYKKFTLYNDFIYFIEFKNSFEIVDEKEMIDFKSGCELYKKAFNNDVIDNLDIPKIDSFSFIYIFNNKEYLSYKFIKENEISARENDIHFVYLNPACQLTSFCKLKLIIDILSNDIKKLKIENAQIRAENVEIKNQLKELKNNIKDILKSLNDNLKDQFKINKDLINVDKLIALENDEDSEYRTIEKEWKSILSNSEDLGKLDSIFVKYKEEISFFQNIKISQISDFDKKENNTINSYDNYQYWTALTCSLVGVRNPKNYVKVKSFILGKIAKNDDMAFMFKCLYLCFFGTRVEDEKIIDNIFYQENKTFLACLKNIVKIIFYYDHDRKKKAIFFLSLMLNFVKIKMTFMKDIILYLKRRNLDELPGICLICLNSENKNFLKAFGDFKSLPKSIQNKY